MFLTRMKQARQNKQEPNEVRKTITQLHRLPKPFLEIFAWAIMPNHFHLVVRQLVENGISSFMHRISNAYSHYYNRKYEGSGSVFQGTFQARLVETEEQFVHLCRYNHTNPILAKLVEPQDLSAFQWTSLKAYLGQEKDILTNTELLMRHFSSKEELEEFTLAPFEDEGVATLEGVTIDDDFGWYEQERQRQKQKHDELIREIKAS